MDIFLWDEAGTYNGEMTWSTFYREECLMRVSVEVRNFQKLINSCLKLLTSRWSLLFFFRMCSEYSKRSITGDLLGVLGSKNSKDQKYRWDRCWQKRPKELLFRKREGRKKVGMPCDLVWGGRGDSIANIQPFKESPHSVTLGASVLSIRRLSWD